MYKKPSRSIISRFSITNLFMIVDPWEYCDAEQLVCASLVIDIARAEIIEWKISDRSRCVAVPNAATEEFCAAEKIAR
jgi:hypothetical protein